MSEQRKDTLIKIPINDKNSYIIEKPVIDALLFDNTTHKNIIFASETYPNHRYYDEITYNFCVKEHLGSRSCKSKEVQIERTNKFGEIYTPAWVCNKQNNSIDEIWFGRKNVFNIEKGTSWELVAHKVEFPPNKTWLDYVVERRMEVSCGEGPYLVSRNDVITGEHIDINNRIGLLDRKIRIVCENAKSKEEWESCVLAALKSIYAYEWQGDSLYIARGNVFLTVLDYYTEVFKCAPPDSFTMAAAVIISWNIFQMDGLKMVIPYSCKNEIVKYEDLLGETNYERFVCRGCQENDFKKHNGIYAKTMDWSTLKPIEFYKLVKV